MELASTYFLSLDICYRSVHVLYTQLRVIMYFISVQRLNNFEILISEVFKSDLLDVFNVIATVEGHLAAAEKRKIPTATLPGGRFVMIRKNGTGVLTLCEVEVYGAKMHGQISIIMRFQQN